MCGICGVVGHRNATPLILEALARLEYRGYDSAGIAVLADGRLERRRAAGKLRNLEAVLQTSPMAGATAIGHTRWATHGAPNEINAHPHLVGRVAVVHNGIIENHEEIRSELEALGRVFSSETDTESVAQLVDYHLSQGLTPQQAAAHSLKRLQGAYALAMIFAESEGLMIGARHGAPLAIGIGEGEMFLGSDSLALAPLARRITYLEDGDWCVLKADAAQIYNSDGIAVERPVQSVALIAGAVGKDGYRHYMEKELHEHPVAIGQTLQRIVDPVTRELRLPEFSFGLSEISHAIISACGSAYYGGLVARYWLESEARLPVQSDVASELRYRDPPLEPGGMALLISQSGETADTLAALRLLRQRQQRVVSVLNVEASTMARESDVVLGMVAGPEISVASTKAFTAQLTVLACLTIAIAQARRVMTLERAVKLTGHLMDLPSRASEVFGRAKEIKAIGEIIADARDVLYLGRGSCFPIALEGALKLKEISYIHAEAYAAGEMKHGPISLIDHEVPIVVLAPSNILFDKVLSNVQEARARGGRIIAITDKKGAERLSGIAEKMVVMPDADAFVVPILYTIPVQMLAYEVAVRKGTDVDQPRNLAKSVTVE